MLSLTLLPGCVQNMRNGSKLRPLEPSPVFADDRSSRRLIPDTVSRDQPVALTAFYTGFAGGKPVTQLPVPLTRELLDRGQERFNIYCAPCHGRTGDGDGMIVQRGFPRPPSYHTDRLRRASIGHFFDVITNGYGLMYSYANRVAPPDRWAIAAYIRVLQRSRSATFADLPPGAQAELEGTTR